MQLQFKTFSSILLRPSVLELSS